MDMTETNIKMCQKAIEIQILWNINKGDIVVEKSEWWIGQTLHTTYYPCVIIGRALPLLQGEVDDGRKKLEARCLTDSCFLTEVDLDKTTWLPRQDQLQIIYAQYVANELEHASYGRTEIMQAFLDFCAWIKEQYHDNPFTCLPTNCFNSGEQLWLAFIMQEIYHKIWNESDWELLKSEVK